MKIDLDKILEMEEIKDLYNRTRGGLGKYMFTKDYILSMLGGIKLEFFKIVKEKLEREEFDVCFSVERYVFLRKDVQLTDKERLWGCEVRRNMEREYTEQIVRELKNEGLNVWYLVGREWGIYFILKRW